MEEEGQALFREIEALPKQGRRRLYTADLRRRVIAFVEKRIAAGGSESKASVEVGIHQATITGWRGGKKRNAKATKATKRVRPIELVEPAKKSGPVLVLGSARVEGLTLDDVLVLVKGLR
ncbi:MAG: IS630 transposase-related protein [Nannocystales bacterium]